MTKKKVKVCVAFSSAESADGYPVYSITGMTATQVQCLVDALTTIAGRPKGIYFSDNTVIAKTILDCIPTFKLF